MSKDRHDSRAKALEAIAKAIADLEFGQVRITVHNSQVVQIEKIERIRLEIESPFDKGAGI